MEINRLSRRILAVSLATGLFGVGLAGIAKADDDFGKLLDEEIASNNGGKGYGPVSDVYRNRLEALEERPWVLRGIESGGTPTIGIGPGHTSPDGPGPARDVRIAGLTPSQYEEIPCGEWLSWWFNKAGAAKYDAAHLHPRADCLAAFRRDVNTGLLILGGIYNLVTAPLTGPGSAASLYSQGLATASSRVAAMQATRQAARFAAARQAARTVGYPPPQATAALVRHLRNNPLRTTKEFNEFQELLQSVWTFTGRGGNGRRYAEWAQMVEKLGSGGKLLPYGFLSVLVGAGVASQASAEDASSGQTGGQGSRVRYEAVKTVDFAQKLEEEIRTNNHGQGYRPVSEAYSRRPHASAHQSILPTTAGWPAAMPGIASPTQSSRAIPNAGVPGPSVSNLAPPVPTPGR